MPVDGIHRFVHPDEGELVVDLSDFEFIGDGLYANVYEVRAIVRGCLFEAGFVLKEFQSNDVGVRSGLCDKALENYAFAKELGLNVFPDYWPNVDKSGILMTNGNNKEMLCCDSRDVIEYRFGIGNLDEIPNFDEFTENLFNQVKLALDNRVVVHFDSIFILLENLGRGASVRKIDFVFGDMDNLGKTDDLERLFACYDEVIMMMLRFLRYNVKEPRCSEYKEKFAKFFNERRRNTLYEND